jgi:hypothetical protein
MRIHIDKKGSWQNGQVGTPLVPLQVIVQDDEGIPAHKLEVRFRLIQGKGRFTHRDAETDAAGGAVAEFMPEAAGPFRIDCLVGGRRGRSTQFTGTIVEAPAAPTKKISADKPATTTAPQPPTAEVALFETEIEQFVRAEVARPDADGTVTTEPTATDAVQSVQPETEAAPETALGVIQNDTVPETGRDTAVTTASSSDTAVTAADGQALEFEPTVIVDESALAPDQTASHSDTAQAEPAEAAPETAEPVVMVEKPTVISDPLPTEPSETTAAPAPPPVGDQEPEAGLASAPKKRFAKLTKGGKIKLAILALAIAGILFIIARLSGTPPEAAITPPLQSGTIDCTGSVIKTVGQTYVFEGCRRVQ